MIFVRLLIVWQVLISKLHTQIFTLWTWYAALTETQPIGLHIQFDLWIFMRTGKDLIDMLYRYSKEMQPDGGGRNVLHPLEYYSCADISDKEKDLEELLVTYMSELYTAGGLLMPIFRERHDQEEPDIMALDQYGNLVLFELKRGKVGGDTALQLMRYAQKFGRYGYVELDHLYRQYSKSDTALSEAHQSVFALTDSLSDVEFNQHQKLVIVGSTSDDTMIGAVNYWRAAGLDIDFLTYRIYKIGEEEYFEFFAKNKKGVLFDTNKSYDEAAVWDMFDKSKISAYGEAADEVRHFQPGDYVFYYHKGAGVIGAGIIDSPVIFEDQTKDERYRSVKLLTPKLRQGSEIKSLSASELKKILNTRGFYYAGTVKVPYLSADDSMLLVNTLRERYDMELL